MSKGLKQRTRVGSGSSAMNGEITKRLECLNACKW